MGDPELMRSPSRPRAGPLIVKQVGELLIEIARRGVASWVEQKLSLALKI